MVLTAVQTTACFGSPDQMGIPHATMHQMQLEGIQSIADLADFEKDSLQQLADNLRRPGKRIADPTQMHLQEQQFQPQHSHMEPSLKRGCLCHVTL